jgi:hypothetical protein
MFKDSNSDFLSVSESRTGILKKEFNNRAGILKKNLTLFLNTPMNSHSSNSDLKESVHLLPKLELSVFCDITINFTRSEVVKTNIET